MNSPIKLHWTIDSVVKQGLVDAQTFVDRVISDSDLGILHFLDFGSDWIKKNGMIKFTNY